MYKKFTNISLNILSLNFDFVVRIEILALSLEWNKNSRAKSKPKMANIDTQCTVNCVSVTYQIAISYKSFV